MVFQVDLVWFDMNILYTQCIYIYITECCVLTWFHKKQTPQYQTWRVKHSSHSLESFWDEPRRFLESTLWRFFDPNLKIIKNHQRNMQKRRSSAFQIFSKLLAADRWCFRKRWRQGILNSQLRKFVRKLKPHDSLKTHNVLGMRKASGIMWNIQGFPLLGTSLKVGATVLHARDAWSNSSRCKMGCHGAKWLGS